MNEHGFFIELYEIYYKYERLNGFLQKKGGAS